MIELNEGQKIAGFIFAGVLWVVSLIIVWGSGLAGILGIGISAGLVIWCLYKKPK